LDRRRRRRVRPEAAERLLHGGPEPHRLGVARLVLQEDVQVGEARAQRLGAPELLARDCAPQARPQVQVRAPGGGGHDPRAVAPAVPPPAHFQVRARAVRHGREVRPVQLARRVVLRDGSRVVLRAVRRVAGLLEVDGGRERAAAAARLAAPAAAAQPPQRLLAALLGPDVDEALAVAARAGDRAPDGQRPLARVRHVARALAGAVHAYLQVVQARRRRRGSHGARGDGRQPGTAGRESASWTRSVPFSGPGRRGFSCPCGFLDPPGVPGRAAGPSALERRGALAHIKKTRS
ncbi:unnamed protein product, partial [Pelagomonas calceolata]